MRIIFKTAMTTLVVTFVAGLADFLVDEANAQELVIPDQSNEQYLKELIRDEIRKNPELIIETLTMFQEEKKELAKQEASKNDVSNIENYYTDLFENDLTPAFGEGDGITVIEFFDYSCGYCKQVAPVLERVKKDFSIQVIYKEFPILNQNSLEAAAVGQLIMNDEPELYEDYHRSVYDLPKGPTREGIIKILNTLDLNVEETFKKASSDKNTELFQSTATLAENLNIQGTPSFIIGDTILRGAPSYENFASLITSLQKEN